MTQRQQLRTDIIDLADPACPRRRTYLHAPRAGDGLYVDGHRYRVQAVVWADPDKEVRPDLILYVVEWPIPWAGI